MLHLLNSIVHIGNQKIKEKLHYKNIQFTRKKL